jgi:hypothetical protein
MEAPFKLPHPVGHFIGKRQADLLAKSPQLISCHRFEIELLQANLRATQLTCRDRLAFESEEQNSSIRRPLTLGDVAARVRGDRLHCLARDRSGLIGTPTASSACATRSRSEITSDIFRRSNLCEIERTFRSNFKPFFGFRIFLNILSMPAYHQSPGTSAIHLEKAVHCGLAHCFPAKALFRPKY